MPYLFFTLLLVSIICLIVGVISPKRFSFLFGRHSVRGKIVPTFLLSTILCFFFIGLTADTPPAESSGQPAAQPPKTIVTEKSQIRHSQISIEQQRIQAAESKAVDEAIRAQKKKSMETSPMIQKDAVKKPPVKKRPIKRVFQKPLDFPSGSPERTFANYISAWEKGQWNEMVRYCQITWRSKEADPAEKLKAHHGWCTPISFRIIDKTGGPGFVTIRYELEIKFGDMIDKKEKTANVIKETAPYKASPDGKFGTWGVNPLSAL